VPLARKIVNAGIYARYLGNSNAAKSAHEMQYWRKQALKESTLGNGHYEAIYTRPFGLDPDYFAGKSMLDIGCGPRGSLEWNEKASERIGLDPLVENYREFGIDKHAMTYINAGAEAIPVEDEHFDIVSAVNSLDHVDNLDDVLAEIRRVLRAGGDLLLVVEVGHAPTITEPVGLWWDDVERFKADYEILVEKHFEKKEHGVFQSMDAGIPFDHTKTGRRE
jgi:ubiquinone/menaquinone biosynthesis C-methylase UbiE